MSGPKSSVPYDFVPFGNGETIFSADDGVHSIEPWITDGTAAGTKLLDDIAPGATSSFPSYFTALGNGKVVFQTYDAQGANPTLWVTDGTLAGTVQLKAMALGHSPDGTENFVAIGGGKALFDGHDSSSASYLWVTDGTVAGTKPLMGADTPADPSGFTSLGNGLVVFASNTTDFTVGEELFVTDGTSQGTRLVKDIYSGDYNSSQPQDFTPIGNGKAVFSARDATYGWELWVTDGTADGTHLVKDINSGPNDSSPKNFASLGNGLAIFNADDPAHGEELWVTDGTTNGTSLIEDFILGPTSSNPVQMTGIGGGKALLTLGAQTWITDGTQSGTHLLKDFTGAGGTYYGAPEQYTPLGNGKTVFQAYSASGEYALWVTDGTVAGTVELKDFQANFQNGFIGEIAATGDGRALFAAPDPVHGEELWVTDGTAAGTVLVKDINPDSLDAPTQAPVSDTGASASDGITKDSTPTFTGTVTAGAKVTLYADTKVVGSATAGKDGTYTVTSAKLLDGSHAMSITTTISGTTTPQSATTAIVIDTKLPTKLAAPTLTSAANAGSTQDATPTFTGTAEAGSLVRLMDGKVLVGSTMADATTGTYTITTGTLADGKHSFTATATDTAGNTSIASTATAVTIDTHAPVTPAAPLVAKASDTGRSTTDGITKDTTLTVTGKAEAGSTVSLYDGTSLLKTFAASTAGTYSTVLTLSEATHTLSVTATDKAGNVSAPSPVTTVVVDLTPPPIPSTPQLDSDTGFSTSDGLTKLSKPVVSGTTEANATITLFDGTKAVGTAIAGSDGTYTIAPTAALKNGAHTLSVSATDAAGNVGAKSGTVSITIDATAPARPATPVLSAASDSGSSSKDGITNDTTPTLSGKAEAGSLVTLLDGTNVVGSVMADATTGAYTITSSALTDGLHKLTVTATDAAGNVSAASVAKSVTIETHAGVAITTPAGAVTSTSQTVKGTGVAGAKITLIDNGGATPVGSATVAANGTWSAKVKLVAGDNSLVANETDLAGNQGSSSAVVLTTPVAHTMMMAADFGHALTVGSFDTGGIVPETTSPHAMNAPSVLTALFSVPHHAV